MSILTKGLVNTASTLLKVASNIQQKDDTGISEEVIYNIREHVAQLENDIGDDVLLQTYQGVLWVFHGVFTTSMAAATVPLRIRRKTDANIQEDCRNHPALDLLDNPNKLLTKFQLIARTVMFMELTGDAYWMKERDGASVKRLHCVRPDAVTTKLVNDTESRRFILKSDKEVLEQDMIHFRHISPFSTVNGLPTILPGKDSILLEIYLSKFAKEFFTNAVVPSLVFSSEQKVGDLSFERFKHQVRNVYQGLGNMHKAVLLDSGIKPINARIPSPADSGYVDASELIRDKIYFGLGTYHMIALANGLAGDTQKAAESYFWRYTVIPRLISIAQTITKELLSDYKGKWEGCYAEFDTRQVSALRDDAASESLGNMRNIMSGVLGHKEARVDMGKPREMQDDDSTGIPKGEDFRRPGDSRVVDNENRAAAEDMMKGVLKEMIQEVLIGNQ